jgi:hypothetical protein
MAGARLGKLLEKKDAINAQIRREQAKARSQERKDDTRRKVLAGAAVLDRGEKDPAFRQVIDTLLAGFLVRPDDRALFGLAPLTSDVTNIASDTAPPADTETGQRTAA